MKTKKERKTKMIFSNRPYTPPANERSIRRAANSSRTMKEVLRKLNYTSSSTGGNTKRRFKSILGGDIYQEIASGIRKTKPKANWNCVPVNKIRS